VQHLIMANIPTPRPSPRKFREHPDIPPYPPKVVYDLLSTTPEEIEDIAPIYIKDTNVYLRSKAILTYNQEDGDSPNSEIHPCYRVEFHAGVLEGEYKHLGVLVTKLFYPPVMNPLNSVNLDIGMVVQVSGMLTAHSHTPRGITALFYLEADIIKRDISFSEARKENQNKRLLRDPQCTPDTSKLGEFTC
jgi:hypothetical protein